MCKLQTQTVSIPLRNSFQKIRSQDGVFGESKLLQQWCGKSGSWRLQRAASTKKGCFSVLRKGLASSFTWPPWCLVVIQILLYFFAKFGVFVAFLER